jgi:hypothetical protein
VPQFHQSLFAVSLVGLIWFGMMAAHELGHVVGAIATGGAVNRVVLHPLTISRTDVSPNPSPGVVVWLGPIVGAGLPLFVLAIPGLNETLRKSLQFFAGFCLIANGAYISIGSFDRVGDCGEMHRTGTPLWVMLIFGGVTISAGLYLWHRLGSIKDFVNNPSVVTARMAYGTLAILLLVILAGFFLSPV